MHAARYEQMQNARRIPKGVRLIATIPIAGVDVEVYRASTEQVVKLADGVDGVFEPSTTAIFVRTGQTASQEQDTIVHECVHAFIYLTGLGNTLRLILGPKRSASWDGDDGIEETLVRQITPHVVALLRSR